MSDAFGQLPRRLEHFRLLRRLNAGGLVEVFLAERLDPDGTPRRFTVRRLPPAAAGRGDPNQHARFVRDARAAVGLVHPNLVRLHELVEDAEDRVVLVTEYVGGADVATVLRALRPRGQRPLPQVAAWIAREVARGLHHAHEHVTADTPRGLVHGEVSTQAVVLSSAGAVQLADLGVSLARVVGEATLGESAVRFLAPEQAAGAPWDRRADVFALGVVFYEMLRMRSPYDRRDLPLLRAVMAGRFAPPIRELTDVPTPLLHVLDKALAHDPAGRYPTALALAEALDSAMGAEVDAAALAALVHLALDSQPGAGLLTVTESTMSAGASPAAPKLLSAGAKVGRYVVKEHLGGGGMADVYSARDTTLDRLLALKVLRDTTSHEARRPLLREAKLAASFEHPGSVVIYDVGEADGVGFIAMELVRGVPMTAFVGDPEVPVSLRIRWLVGCARALAAAHTAGLVHRDVKPSNLMVRDRVEVKVLDFGIARFQEAPEPASMRAPGEHTFVGTLRYAAPESFGAEEVDARADQFSWGVVAWELLAGRHPFRECDAYEAAARMLTEGIAPLATVAPEVPAEVARAVDRALAPRPDDRFTSLDEAADALAPFADAASTEASPRLDPRLDPRPDPATPALADPRPPGAERTGWRRRALLGVAAAGIAGLVAYAWPRAERAPPRPAPPPAPIVDAVGCTLATVEGGGDPTLARALGRGACARLGPELGVEWGVPDARHHLEVRASLRPELAAITLSIAGQEATGTAPVPITALWNAIAALTPKLASPRWPAERVRTWGARDEASARRIFRVWRHSGGSLLPSVTSEVTRLLETDGDSPIPHLLAVMNAIGDHQRLSAEPQRVLERLDRLPPARASTIRAMFLAFPAETNRKEATRLFREAYAASPDDHAMTGLYAVLAARMGLPESDALVERLHRDAPTYSVGPLNNATFRSAYRDDARDAKYIAWLDELLPESLGRPHPVQRLASMGRFAEARAALDLTRRLGFDSVAGDPLLHGEARAQIELAALAPRAAREHTTLLQADPRLFGSLKGNLSVVASLLQEGRFDAAGTALAENAKRHVDQGDLGNAFQFALASLRLARWLNKPPSPRDAEWAEAALRTDEISKHERLLAQGELALLRRGPAVEAALRSLEEVAEREADGDALVRDRALVLGVALARVARGDRAAAELWRRTGRAPHLARRAAALDAALALERVGDVKGAEDAYLLAAEAANNGEDAAARVLALARLPELLRRHGRAGEATDRAAELERRWAGADPGLRAAVRRLR